MAQQRKFGKQSFHGMIPSDRFVPTPTTTSPSSSAASSFGATIQRGASPARKSHQSLLNRQLENHDKMHQAPVFFPQNPLAPQSPESPPASQTFASVPNADGTFDTVPMTMVMIPNQALMFALTHNHPTTVLPLWIGSNEDLPHSTYQPSGNVDSQLLQPHREGQIPENIPDTNFADLHNAEQQGDQIIDKYDNEETMAAVCEEPIRSNSPNLNYSQQLTNNVLLQDHNNTNNIPSRVDRRQLAKRRLLITTQEQEQRRLQLQRINSKTSNSPSSDTRIVDKLEPAQTATVTNKTKSQSQRRNPPNSLQKAISATTRTAGTSITTTSGVSLTGGAANASRNKRIVWLSPRNYHPLQKHAWSPSATATSSSANRYDRKQNALSPLDDEDQLHLLQHVDGAPKIGNEVAISLDYKEDCQTNYTNDKVNNDDTQIINYYITPDRIANARSRNEGDNDTTSERSNHLSNIQLHLPSPKADADEIIERNEQEYKIDGGMTEFGNLLEASSVVHHDGESKPTIASVEDSKSIFCLIAPDHATITHPAETKSLVISLDDVHLENNRDNLEPNKNGLLHSLTNESRQYFLHSAECINDAVERHNRYRQKHFLYELKREVDRVNHHWQMIQRASMFRKHYGVVPIFARWLTYARKRQQQRYRILQKSSVSSLLMTKLLVSSTETIAAYVEVNDMKKSLQCWRQRKEENHWRREKATKIVVMLATSAIKKAFSEWRRHKSNSRRSDPIVGINQLLIQSVSAEENRTQEQIEGNTCKPAGVFVSPEYFEEEPSAASVRANEVKNIASADEGHDSKEVHQDQRGIDVTIASADEGHDSKEEYQDQQGIDAEKTTEDNLLVNANENPYSSTISFIHPIENFTAMDSVHLLQVQSQEVPTANSVSPALSTENCTTENQQPFEHLLHSTMDISAGLDVSKPEIEKEEVTSAERFALESAPLTETPVLIPQELSVTIIANLATSDKTNGDDCKSSISMSPLPTLDSDKSPSLYASYVTSASHSMEFAQPELRISQLDALIQYFGGEEGGTENESKLKVSEPLLHGVQENVPTSIDYNPDSLPWRKSGSSKLVFHADIANFPSQPEQITHPIAAHHEMNNDNEEYEPHVQYGKSWREIELCSPSHTFFDDGNLSSTYSNEPTSFIPSSSSPTSAMQTNRVRYVPHDSIDIFLETYSSTNDPIPSSYKINSSGANDDEQRTETSGTLNRQKLSLQNIEDKIMAIMKSHNNLSGQGNMSIVPLLRNDTVSFGEDILVDLETKNQDEKQAISRLSQQSNHTSAFPIDNNHEYYDGNKYPSDNEQNIYDIDYFPHQEFPRMGDAIYSKRFEHHEPSSHLIPSLHASFQHGSQLTTTPLHNIPGSDGNGEGEEYYEDDFENASHDQVDVLDDAHDSEHPLSADPQIALLNSLAHNSLKAEQSSVLTESMNDSPYNTESKVNEIILHSPTAVYGARDMEEQDVVNHTNQDDYMDLLPVYEGEDELQFAHHVDQEFVTESGSGLPPLQHSMTVSPVETWEDSENFLLSGRGTPFAAFRDDLLPPLPSSPCNDECEFSNNDENDPGRADINDDLKFEVDIIAAEETISENRWTPFHFVEAAAEVLPAQFIASTEEPPAPIMEVPHHAYIAASMSDTEGLTASLPMSQSELATTIPQWNGYRTVSMRKALAFHRRRHLSSAFYQLIQVLLKATVQRQVIQLISAPAAKRLAQQRALTHWRRSLFRYREDNQPLVGRSKDSSGHSPQMSQRYKIHDTIDFHDANRQSQEGVEYDEYEAYQDYADDNDDVIRIIDISEL
jgi:hypothetical protein